MADSVAGRRKRDTPHSAAIKKELAAAKEAGVTQAQIAEALGRRGPISKFFNSPSAVRRRIRRLITRAGGTHSRTLGE